MPCSISNLSNIRKLYIECQQSILDKYEISVDKRIIFNSVSYLVVHLDKNEYSRVEMGEKASFTDTFKNAFITPRLIRVGFTAKINDDMANFKRCLEFISVSSISTSYSSVYIPVTVIDYVRPEFDDESFTIRKGLLSVSAGSGYSGSDSNLRPMYAEDYEISFQEYNKRLVM